MGQQEIIEHLRVLRKTGDDDYHSIRDIAKALDASYYAVRKSIYSLARKDIVDHKATGSLYDWYRSFRLASKYVDENNIPINNEGVK